MAEHGIHFGKPRIDAAKLGEWKNSVVGKLTGGLTQLARQRKVTVVQGTAKFESANRLVTRSPPISTASAAHSGSQARPRRAAASSTDHPAIEPQ